MKRESFAAIHASPRERAQETAEAVAAACGVNAIVTEPELDEVDFGEEWSGKDFDTLNQDSLWRRWNDTRSFARTRGGESMLDVQSRAMGVVERLMEAYAGAALVLVSHGDVIKSIVSHVLGLPIDAWPRLEISPASISTFVAGDWGATLLTLNEVVA
jgi:broad specificity phosphatase PhoE